MSRDIAERQSEEREKLLHDLGERVKELRCLYSLSELLEQPGLSLEEIMTGILQRMPPAFQYPEVTRARIQLDDHTFATPGFRDTPWRLAADIVVEGTRAGTLELCYLEAKPEADEGPFLKEERALIDAVAERTGKLLLWLRSQQRVERLTRLYATLSQTNEAIVRCTDRDALFSQVCRIAVEQGGFDCAYVGMLDESRTRIRIAAHHGRGSTEVQLIADAVEDVRTIPGQTAAAIREGRVMHSNDYEAEAPSGVWGEAGLRLGFQGAAALPLRLNGEVVGALGLYVGEKEFFDQAQLKLLGEMAMDLSFALDNFDREERRRASEQALRESEEKFRRVGASAQDAVIVIDHDGLITDWNRSAERMFQYPAAEAVGKNMHALLAPARYREAIERGLKEFRRSGTGPVVNQTLELSAMRRDGVEIPVEFSISALQIKGSWHAVGLVRDISERIEAQRKLEKLAHDQELLLQSTDQGIYGLDTAGHCTFINQAAARMLGLEPGDIVGRDMHALTHHSRDDGSPFPVESCPIYVVFRTGEGCRIDGEVFWRSDGTSFPVEYSSFPVLHEGHPVGAVVTFNDISRRKAAEQDLWRTNKLLETMFSGINLLVAYMDADFNFLRVNRLYAQADGRDPEFFPGKNHFALYPDAENEAIFRRVVATGEPYVADARPFQYPEHPERGVSYWDWNLQPLKASDGRVEGIVMTLQDVTERKRAEQSLEHSHASLAEAQRVAHLGNWDLDLVNNVLQWSAEIYRIFEIDPGQFGASYDAFLAIIHPDDRAAVNQAYTEHVNKRLPYDIVHRLLFGDGRVKYVHERCETFYDNDGSPLRSIGTVQDVTERRQREIALGKLNRALATLSRCNEALIHATEEAALLSEMCRIIVEVGGYRLAWVGYAEHDAPKSVRPVAQCGHEESYLERANITWAEGERGRGPVGTAIRSGGIQVVADTATDSGFAPWREDALRLGYASVVSLPLAQDSEVFGALNIYGSEVNAFDEAEIRLLSELAGDLAFGIATLREREDRRRTRERLERSMERTITAISVALEKRDPYTAGHQRRVAELAVAVARELALPEETIKGIHFGATIHDIGKIYVPAEILTRPGRLTRNEFELIKSHSQVGYEIVQGVEFPWPVAEMILQHHERLDGSGYPSGLKGEGIAIEARILAVADVVEAMCSHRPYRAAVGEDKAIDEIEAGRGIRYDEAVADACIRLFRDKGFHWREQGGPG